MGVDTETGNTMTVLVGGPEKNSQFNWGQKVKKVVAGMAVSVVLLLPGCEFKTAGIDLAAVEFMPRDVAIAYVKKNLKPWPDGNGLDPCVMADDGVFMDGNFHAYADTRLIIERYTTADRYDIRGLENTWVIPDFCSYYKGDDGTGLLLAEIEKIDRIGTAFTTLGSNVPSH